MKEKKLLEEIGLNIRRLRKEREISQQDFAALCNFEKSNMCRIEMGNTNLTIKTLFRISKGLGVSLSELIDVEKPKRNK